MSGFSETQCMYVDLEHLILHKVSSYVLQSDDI